MTPTLLRPKTRNSTFFGAALALCLFVTGCASHAASVDTNASDLIAPSTTSTHAVSTTDMPPELAELVQEEVSGLSLEYPQGVKAPSPTELIPELSDATVRKGESGGVIIQTADNPESSEGNTSENSGSGPRTIIMHKGDYATRLAQNWQCAWVREYVSANDSGATERMTTALTHIRAFADLEVIRVYNLELAGETKRVLIPKLESGDIDYVRTTYPACWQ
ncbi:MAG: hypothetical protein Q4C87_10015 [Actinomycetaceae bacterium]|nr:hypothetical protein [Actinomycetaceae bacterium]